MVMKNRRKRTCKRKDDSEPVYTCTSDDSGDELKVKFAREASYKVKDGSPEDPKRQHNAGMEVDTTISKPYYKQNKI